MGEEEWFPPGEAATGRGEDEPAPGATVLMGDEVLRRKTGKRPSDRKLSFQIKSLILQESNQTGSFSDLLD